MSIIQNEDPMTPRIRKLICEALPSRAVAFALLAMSGLAACNRVDGYEESFDRAILAAVTTFEVADSSRTDSIRVHLAGIIGQSTAFSFDRINAPRTDSLFQIGVWGRWRESSGQVYELVNIVFDTTLVLQSPRLGMHFFRVFSPDTTLTDSTYVY